MLSRFISAGIVSMLALSLGVGLAVRLSQQLYTNPPALSSAQLNSEGPTFSTDDSLTAGPRPLSRYPQQTNVLELPGSDREFIGYWGGFTHTSIEQIDAGLEGSAPKRVSIIFGERGRSMFAESELYAPIGQKIVRSPQVTARHHVITIEYESRDRDLYYFCSHRFEMLNEQQIGYQATIRVYTLQRDQLMGIVTQQATLKRLLTVPEQLRFVWPSKREIPRLAISVNNPED